MGLGREQVEQKLRELDGWAVAGQTLHKTYEVKGFSAALLLASAIGVFANELNHHPDLNIHGYNKLTVSITTHSENALTEKDFELAHKIATLG